jgi:nitrogen fixation protein FixH
VSRELTGRGVLAWLFAFFFLIFGANAWFIYAAVSTFRGEDDQKPYLQGISYGETLSQRAEQARQGWHATIAADRLQSGKVRVEVTLRRRNGAPERDVRLVGELRHPTDETRDRSLRLVEVAEGDYRADVGGVGTGAWDVVVKASPGTAPFEASRRLWVP